MDINKVLFEKFKLTSFRTGQQEIIEDLLNHRDVLAMLPTGSGKSLCYQLPALMVPGLTIVVSPLLSLMEDQVQQLKSQGIKDIVAVNSFLSMEERKEILRNLHKQKIVYVSPEVLQSNRLRKQLKQLSIAFFVVDEAHCISQWGHEFRTDYLKLSEVREDLGNPPCLAITATAPKEVQQDIISKLQLRSCTKHIYSVDRPNIGIIVKKCGNSYAEKAAELSYMIKNLQGPGIVYASTRKTTEDLAKTLYNEGVNGISYYHGGMNNEDRLLIQQQFVNDELKLICCTSAFGMGINKPNIRYVIHFHTPLQMESYLQEIGRAGRDGQSSVAITLVSDEEPVLQKALLVQEFPNQEQLRSVLKYLQSTVRELSVKESELLVVTQISEVMWRFIRFHLEEQGVIVDDKYRQSSVKETELLQKLESIIAERIKYKQEKFNKFQQWIFDETKCKRVAILDQFNENLMKKPLYCCNICGIDMENYFIHDNEHSEYVFQSWQNELKRIFHQ